jgi:hypothetical protein
MKAMGCRKVRNLFPELNGNRKTKEVTGEARQAAQVHLEHCARCAEEYRVYSLSQTVLDLAASPEIIEPDKDFYVALRARIARGQTLPGLTRVNGEEPWTAILWLTARQMIPAMALLLLLMLGATLLWSQPAKTEHGATARIDVSEPTADDVIDSTFIVAEERLQNGK